MLKELRDGSDVLDYLTNRDQFGYKNGFVEIPHGPGLGIEINEEKVRKAAAVGHDWKSPIWRNEDGSYAEW